MGDPNPNPNGEIVAFIGLGAMGYHMAGNITAGLGGGAALIESVTLLPSCKLRIWNRTHAKALQHAEEFGSVASRTLEQLVISGEHPPSYAPDVIISCLPTSAQVREVAAILAPKLKRGSLWIDATSGEPLATRAIAADILTPAGVAMCDCPVSGGPSGAASGQLTAMVGGEAAAVARAMPLVALFARKKIVPCGGLGCACAVKSVNNALNVSHLALAGEGLLALAKFGVAPDVALVFKMITCVFKMISCVSRMMSSLLYMINCVLQMMNYVLRMMTYVLNMMNCVLKMMKNAINGSSGRSLQTQERLPQAVLTRKFNYGFKLGLMLKDIDIALTDVLPTVSDDNGEGTGAARGIQFCI